jgi:hypothetical protein
MIRETSGFNIVVHQAFLPSSYGKISAFYSLILKREKTSLQILEGGNCKETVMHNSA